MSDTDVSQCWRCVNCSMSSYSDRATYCKLGRNGDGVETFASNVIDTDACKYEPAPHGVSP